MLIEGDAAGQALVLANQQLQKSRWRGSVLLVTDGVCSGSDEGHDCLLAIYRQRYSQQIETADSETVLSCWA